MTAFPDEQPEPGKASYVISPEDGTNASQTASDVKNVTGADDLQPRMDGHHELSSRPVEATKEEISQLREHDGIDHIDKLDVPAQAKAEEPDSANAGEHESYIIFPDEGISREKADAVDATLRKVLQSRIRKPSIVWKEKVGWWVAEMNSTEVGWVSRVDGVHGVEQNVLFEGKFVSIEKYSEPDAGPL